MRWELHFHVDLLHVEKLLAAAPRLPFHKLTPFSPAGHLRFHCCAAMAPTALTWWRAFRCFATCSKVWTSFARRALCTGT